MLLRCCKERRRLVSRGAKRGNVDVSDECYLVISHAPFLGEVGAGGALLVTVAIVKH